MNLNPTFRTHARLARQLQRRAAEMRSGRHDETHAIAMHFAGAHIATLGRLVATLEKRLAEAEAPKRKPAPFLRPAATVAALALGAATFAAILGNWP